MKLKYLWLILFSFVPGCLSSLVYWIASLSRGIVLSVCITIGLIFINYYQQKGVKDVKQKISVIGVSCGLTAGIILVILSSVFCIESPVRYPFNPVYNNFSSIIICCTYGFCLHHAYATHWNYDIDTYTQTNKHIMRAAVYIILVRLLLAIPMLSMAGHANWEMTLFNITVYFIMVISGTLPFTIAWYFLLMIFDPMWNATRGGSIGNEAETGE